MTVQDLYADRPGSEPRRDAAGRVIEWEFQLPRAPRVQAPSVDLEPARRAAERILVVGIGTAVLMRRRVSSAVQAAERAGEEAAAQPDTVAHTLVRLVRRQEATKAPRAAAQPRLRVPVVPIEGYDALSVEEVVTRLAGLSADELRTLREYEVAHEARAAVLDGIDARLNA